MKSIVVDPTIETKLYRYAAKVRPYMNDLIQEANQRNFRTTRHQNGLRESL